jgi:glycerate-2-kinase
MKRAKEAGVDVLEELNRHNSFCALKKLEDTIITGARGTNVQDLRILYVGD